LGVQDAVKGDVIGEHRQRLQDEVRDCLVGRLVLAEAYYFHLAVIEVRNFRRDCVVEMAGEDLEGLLVVIVGEIRCCSRHCPDFVRQIVDS
jgi:hypothetical protein